MKFAILFCLLMSGCGVAIQPYPVPIVEVHPYPVPMGARGQFCRNIAGYPMCDPGLYCAHLRTSPYFTWQMWRCTDLITAPPEMFDAIHPPGTIVSVGIFLTSDDIDD